MEKEFVPYELSIELKELGFDEPCFGGWDKNKKWYYHPDSDIIVDAPLWQQAFDWCLNKIPQYSIRICYNKTGEILIVDHTIDIFNYFTECLEILIDLIEEEIND